MVCFCLETAVNLLLMAVVKRTRTLLRKYKICFHEARVVRAELLHDNTMYDMESWVRHERRIFLLESRSLDRLYIGIPKQLKLWHELLVIVIPWIRLPYETRRRCGYRSTIDCPSWTNKIWKDGGVRDKMDGKTSSSTLAIFAISDTSCNIIKGNLLAAWLRIRLCQIVF